MPSIPSHMKAVLANGKKGAPGPATALQIVTIDTPTPEAHQCLVRIKAFGLNRMDLMEREGHYPMPPWAPENGVMGVEFSGVVVKPAQDGSHNGKEGLFKEGDEVFGLAYGGAYAEYIAVSVTMLIHKPKELSWEEAAGIPETWITATQAMYLIGEFAPGKSILWHAGASSVSIAGIQLAKADGASAIYTTAGSDEKVSFTTKLGATKGFNYHNEDWAKGVQDATDGKGVDIIVDYIGRNYVQGNFTAAARDARIVQLAFMSGMTLPEGVNIGPMLFKRIRWEGSSLRSRDAEYQGKLRDTLVEHALPKFVKGDFKVIIEKVFDWKDVVEAHQTMESNKTQGKLICTVPWE